MEFGKQTLISGRNTAGKSTIIDALQVLFIADQRQIRFNSAAHEEAKRSLINYLRGKIGSEEKKFVRDGDFTSYIMAEFRDEKKREDFVVGAVFDVDKDYSIDDEYFILPHTKLQDVEIVGASGHLKTRDEFHRYAERLCRQKPVQERTKSSFQKAFLHRMGQIQDRFFSTFTKALSFKPIQDIRDFVYDYILDKQDLQLEVMKQNFEIHERYQQELEALQERKAALARIKEQFEAYVRLRDLVAIQEYVLRGLKCAERVEYQESAAGQVRDLEHRLESAENDAQLYGTKHQEAQEKTQEAYLKWNEHDIKRKQEDLQAEIAGLKQKITDTEGFLQAFNAQTREEAELIERLAAWEGSANWIWQPGEINFLADIVQLLRALPWQEQTVEEGILAYAEMDRLARTLKETGVFLAGLHERFLKVSGRLEDQITEQEQESARLQQEIKDLEQKKRPYRPEVLRLKKLLEERFQGRSAVWIFCEEMEILDEAWRNAIEGYLHTQRFDLLVEPRVFAEALTLYEREKWQHNLEAVGLVDTEKEQKYLKSGAKDSLAELLQTDNPVIQARINHLLGQVMRAKNEQDLRNFPTAVTQSCMVYHHLVARQMEKQRYATPYIGAKAVERQLALKREELANVEKSLAALRQEEELIKKWAGQLRERISLYQSLAQQLELPYELAKLKEQCAGKEEELAGLNLSEVEELELEYKFWRTKQQDFLNLMTKAKEECTGLRIKLDQSRTEHYLAGNQVRDALEHWEAWKQVYPPELWSKAEERFREAEAQTLATRTKITNWEGNKKGNETRHNQEYQELIKLRQAYSLTYGYDSDAQAEDNDGYQKLLTEIETVNIPEYQQKLAEALHQSEEEFKSQFIYQLREAILDAKDTFGVLNYALKSFPFHEDHYHFEVKASDKYKRFYDVIMDPDLVERGSLFDSLADAKSDTLHELFERLIRGEAGEQEEFTDYRRYLDFDITVTNQNGHYSFSQVLKEKSGGETQTPFYIAILASFHHLYSDKTMRLVVFDEAFNKMDEERIQTSLRLIKRMNLQLIAAVPDEKMQHMAPEVSTTLIVHRDGYNCFVDMISREEMLESLRGDGESQTAHSGSDVETNEEGGGMAKQREYVSVEEEKRPEKAEPLDDSGGLFEEPSLF